MIGITSSLLVNFQMTSENNHYIQNLLVTTFRYPPKARPDSL